MRRLPLLAFLLASTLVGSTVPASAGSSAAPTVELLDAGSDPKEALRLTLAPGAQQTSTVTFTTSVQQSGAANQTIGPIRIRFGLAVSVAETDADGNVHLDVTYPSFELLDGTDVGGGSESDLRDTLESFNGMSGEIVMRPTGAVLSTDFELPDTADSAAQELIDDLSDQASQLAIPFPEEPVGVGAKWKATTELEVNGIDVTQTYTYAVRERDGERLVLDVRYVQRGADQELDLPNVPVGATVRLTHFKITGKGTQTAVLSQPLPTEGKVRSSGRQELQLEQDGDTEDLSQRISIAVSVKPAA